MKKKFLATALCVVMSVGLMACGGSSSSSAKVANIATGSSSGDYEYGGAVLGTEYDVSTLTLYENGTYELVDSWITDMGGVIGGTTSSTVYGTYKKGETTDGYIPVELSAATRIVYASNSTLGGYAFDYDTDTDTEFIIPGGDDVAIDKDSFISQLGYGETKTVYIGTNSDGAENCMLTFELQ